MTLRLMMMHQQYQVWLTFKISSSNCSHSQWHFVSWWCNSILSLVDVSDSITTCLDSLWHFVSWWCTSNTKCGWRFRQHRQPVWIHYDTLSHDDAPSHQVWLTFGTPSPNCSHSLWLLNEWMNEHVYMAHKNTSTQNLHVHSARVRTFRLIMMHQPTKFGWRLIKKHLQTVIMHGTSAHNDAPAYQVWLTFN